MTNMPKTIFKPHYKRTEEGFSTKITSYSPKGLKSFTIHITTHVLYDGDGNKIECLREAEKQLKRSLGGYRRLRSNEWDTIMLNMDYPNRDNGKGNSIFLDVEVTAIVRDKVKYYDDVSESLQLMKDFAITSLRRNKDFNFNSNKVRK